MSAGLRVMIDNEQVGRLWLDDRGTFCFCYEQSWLERSAFPLSLSLPLRPDPFLADESHPFFANLLPEERMRTLIARNLGVSFANDYGILERIGGDCAGAVSLYPEDSAHPRQPAVYRELSLDELADIIRQLPQRPLLAGEKGVRLSLAGAQKKLPVYQDGDRYCLGYGGAPSNYIIKPPIDDLDGTVENEAYCMALARAVGLDVPESFILQHGDLRVFVVKRFDRLNSGSTIRRLHQEDFCQALRIPPEFKYEAEGGPSLAASFDLLRRNSIRSGKDMLSLLNWLIFNYLVGNSDAHAKNISLLLLPEGPRLAPFYDLLSTRVYGHFGLAEGLAMRIGGVSDPNAVRKTHWEKFAEEAGIKPKLVFSRLAALAQQIEAARLPLFAGEFGPYRCDALYRMMELIALQCKKSEKLAA